MAEHDTPTHEEMLAMANAMLAYCDETRARIDHIQGMCDALIQSIQRHGETPVEAPVQRPVQPSQHLREHRPGRPKKLAADPELRAFVEARFNRMTFEQIADEVAQNFPPERRVAKSAIHAWWHAHYKRK